MTTDENYKYISANKSSHWYLSNRFSRVREQGNFWAGQNREIMKIRREQKECEGEQIYGEDRGGF